MKLHYEHEFRAPNRDGIPLKKYIHFLEIIV